MPYVNIRVAGPLTQEQRRKMCKNVTKAVAEAANKPEENILVFIDEQPRTNVGRGGKLFEDNE